MVSPLQSGTATATKPFRDAWNWVGDLFSAKSQNKALKQEVQQLRAAVAQELTTQNENEQLRAAPRLQGQRGVPQGHAHGDGARHRPHHERLVLRPRPSTPAAATAWRSTTPVVNGQGLVGRVTAVTLNASQVMLVTDQESYIDAMIEPGPGRAAPRASSAAA